MLRPDGGKLSIRVSEPRDSLRSSGKSSSKVSPKSPLAPDSLKMQKWQDAQSVEWKPKRTRRGSAPRALSHRQPKSPRSKSPSRSPRSPNSQAHSPKLARSSTVDVVDDSDLLSKFARGTNGPARISGSDPREGGRKTSKFLSRQGSPEAEDDDLDARFGRGSRAPSALSTGRFGFASRRNSQKPGPPKKDRPNPQYERSSQRDKAMRRTSWRPSKDPKADSSL